MASVVRLTLFRIWGGHQSRCASHIGTVEQRALALRHKAHVSATVDIWWHRHFGDETTGPIGPHLLAGTCSGACHISTGKTWQNMAKHGKTCHHRIPSKYIKIHHVGVGWILWICCEKIARKSKKSRSLHLKQFFSAGFFLHFVPSWKKRKQRPFQKAQLQTTSLRHQCLVRPSHPRSRNSCHWWRKLLPADPRCKLISSNHCKPENLLKTQQLKLQNLHLNIFKPFKKHLLAVATQTLSVLALHLRGDTWLHQLTWFGRLAWRDMTSGLGVVTCGDLGAWCLVLSVMKNSVEVSGGTEENHLEVLLQKEMGQSKTETRQLNQKMNKY